MQFLVSRSQLACRYEYINICYIIYYLNLLFSSFVYIFWVLFVHCFKFKSLSFFFPLSLSLSLSSFIFIIFKISLFDLAVQPLTHWLNQCY